MVLRSQVRLEQDWLLDRTIQCGSSPAVTGQEIVIDLNGFTIDMSDPDAAISLQGGEPVGQQVGNTLRLCNGRVSGLSSTKLSAVEFTKIILENVELVLNSDFTYDNAALDIEGNCVLSGQAAASLIFQSDADLKIKKGALLTVLDGINYIHNSSEETNFVFEAVSSRLMLLGGNFICSENASSPLVLSVGTLIVDHLVTIDVGAFGMVLSDGQDPLSVEILPGALIRVSGSGTLSYSALA
jgi:hypothetical protein